ncbi:hypothetical protein M0805_003588 [Coniferiporia weirii]|nr:hypothetical protein M0805_003588 [Coniferiporia weirii]
MTSISRPTTLNPPLKYTYLRLHIDGGDNARTSAPDELSFRKMVQDTLAQTFGVFAAGMYVDVLRLRYGRVDAIEGRSPDGQLQGGDAVIRVARGDAPQLKTALVTVQASGLRLAVVDESDFLPALLASVPLSG